LKKQQPRNANNVVITKDNFRFKMFLFFVGIAEGATDLSRGPLILSFIFAGADL
jgi:hypothetical protein